MQAGKPNTPTPSGSAGGLSQPDLLVPGDHIGRYRIDRVLGMGGMGQVYAAWDPTLDREVALKVLCRANPRTIAAFKREFRSLSDVRHPNVIRLHELTCSGDNWYFTMELVDGEDLYSHVCGQYDPTFTKLRKTLTQLADALCALHATGKVHRDVKPNNVLIERGKRVVLVDFGLVEDFLHPIETTRLMVGTIAYVSPEQAAGRMPSPASDWYSFGVILYQGLTGELPFAGRPMQVLKEKQSAAPKAPADVAMNVPDDLNQLCIDLLQIDPAKRPTGAEVLKRLGKKLRPARRKATTVGNQFVGRPEHLKRLETAYELVRQGQPAVALVHGLSGMGKSALVTRFGRNVQKNGGLFLSGRCYERESVPYKGFDGVVEELSRYLRDIPEGELAQLVPDDIWALAQLFPSLAHLERMKPPQRRIEWEALSARRRRAFAVLRRLIERVSARWPLVITLDDMQWADPDTAALLIDLMMHPAPSLLLLLTYRTGEHETSAALRALLGEGSPLCPTRTKVTTFELAVGVLSATDSEELARSLLNADGELADRQVEKITAEAKGNPYFIGELARFVNEQGEDALSGEDNLDQVINVRARSLGDSAHRLVSMIALAGRPLPAAVAVAAANLGGANHDALERLLEARLIRTRQMPSANWVEVYHDRIRESLVNALPTEELGQLHLRLAEAFEMCGTGDPERLAVHFHSGGDMARAARYTAEAADRAANALAFDRAARLYQLSLELAPEDADRTALQRRYGDALASAGRAGDAAGMYIIASEREDEDGARELRRLAADQLMRSGHFDDGLAIWNQILKRLGIRTPKSTLSALLPLLWVRLRLRLRGLRFRRRDDIDRQELEAVDELQWASFALSFAQPTLGHYLSSHYVLRALDSGDQYRAALAVAWEAGATSIGGTLTDRRTRSLVRRAEELCRGVECPRDARYVYPMEMAFSADLACLAFYQTRFADAVAPLLETLTGLERLTWTAWESETLRYHLLWALFYTGQTSEFRRHLEIGRERAEAREDRWALAGLRIAGIMNALINDDLGEAEELDRRALESWGGAWGETASAVDAYTVWSYYTRAQLDLYAGRFYEGWQRLYGARRRLQKSFILARAQIARTLIWQARGALALAAIQSGQAGRHRKKLLREVKRAIRILEKDGTAFSSPLAATLKAGLSRLSGESDKTVVQLLRAVDDFAEARMPVHEAACLLALGELGGPAHQDKVATATAALESHGIQHPRRFAVMIVPGLINQTPPALAPAPPALESQNDNS